MISGLEQSNPTLWRWTTSTKLPSCFLTWRWKRTLRWPDTASDDLLFSQAAVHGIVVIYDIGGVTTSHTLMMTPAIMKKHVVVFQVGEKRLLSYRWQNFWIVSKIGIRQKNSIISKSNVSTLTLDDPMYYLWRAGTIFFQFMQKKEKNHMSKNWLPRGTFLSVSSCLNVFFSLRTPTQWTTWPWLRCLPCTTSTCPKLFANSFFCP